MVKQLILIKRKAGMTFEEFKRHYLEVHAPLVLKTFPEMKKYSVNLALQRGKETAYDAIAEIDWPDFDTLSKTGKSDLYKSVIRPDEEKFIGDARVILTEEYVQK